MYDSDAARRTGRRLPYVRCEGVGALPAHPFRHFRLYERLMELRPLEELGEDRL